MAEAAGLCCFASFDMIFICQTAVYWWIYCMQLSDFGLSFAMNLLGKFALAAASCVFALGGAIAEGIARAMEGRHTAATGFISGAGISVISVAIFALHELFDSIINGIFRSKVHAAVAIIFLFLVGHASGDSPPRATTLPQGKQWRGHQPGSIVVLVVCGAVVVIAVVIVILLYFRKLGQEPNVQPRKVDEA